MKKNKEDYMKDQSYEKIIYDIFITNINKASILKQWSIGSDRSMSQNTVSKVYTNTYT